MPVTNDERTAISKLNDADKANAVQEQLKRIREAATGPAMNHEVVNDALEHIEVLTAKAPAKVEPVKKVKEDA